MRSPSPEDLAAIIAAVEVSWPPPAAAALSPRPDRADRWRFSGRWWVRPVIGRRDRPWRR